MLKKKQVTNYSDK